MPFTGVNPSGTPIDEKVLAADKSIEVVHGTEATNAEASHDKAEALPIIPWSLAVVFFTSTIVLAVVHHKSHSR